MKQRPIRRPEGRSIDPGLFLLAAAVLFLSFTPGPVPAQSASGGQEVASPASETQHSTTEEPTEPADANPTLSPEREALAQRIFNELISPCCWTTTVAQHGSGAAPRIQAEVRRMIASGMGHQAILDRYVQEYGERILASPEKKGFNLAVYLVPPLGLVIGALFIARAVRKRSKDRPASAVAGARERGPGTAGPPAQARPAAGSDEDYRRRIEEEVRNSS
jgi:cytochrome c-type biogenesis protein CcmH